MISSKKASQSKITSFLNSGPLSKKPKKQKVEGVEEIIVLDSDEDEQCTDNNNKHSSFDSTELLPGKESSDPNPLVVSEVSEDGLCTVPDVISVAYGHELFASFITRISDLLDGLLDENEMKHLTTFQTLPVGCQELYLRLFHRKNTWIQSSRIKYPDIADDLGPHLRHLVQHGFLEDKSALVDHQAVLDLLTHSQLVEMAKKFRVSHQGNKDDILSRIYAYCDNQPTVFGANSVGIVLKTALNILEGAYRLSDTLLYSLYSVVVLATIGGAFDADPNLFSPLGLISFYNYREARKLSYPWLSDVDEVRPNLLRLLFPTRDHLYWYSECRRLYHSLSVAVGNKEWSHAFELVQISEAQWNNEELLQLSARDCSLPRYLRRYTARGLLARCLEIGATEVLTHQKMEVDACHTIKTLLSQHVYSSNRRAALWQRLCINAQRKLKFSSGELLHILSDAVSDVYLAEHEKYDMVLRARKISSDLAEFPVLLEWKIPSEPKAITISGTLTRRSISGRVNVFVLSGGDNNNDDDQNGSSEDERVVGPEQVALRYYQTDEGFTYGVHMESLPYQLLFTLLLWDVLYTVERDVVLSSYQTFPLDLHYHDFYQERASAIEDILLQAESHDSTSLADLLLEKFCAHRGKACLFSVRGSWEDSLGVLNQEDYLRSFIVALGSKHLVQIVRRMALDYRKCRSGFPDLTLWKSVVSTGDDDKDDQVNFKVVEVKGPGDVLSAKQRYWIEFFTSIGVPAEVCHIKAVNSKRLR